MGLRSSCELARITAADVEETDRGMMWRVYSSKTKKIRKIPVSRAVAELAHQLMKTAPKGSGLPLFRNTMCRPRKRMTGVVRFLTIKAMLDWDKDPVKAWYSCYTYWHTFVHSMLSGYWTGGVGCFIETLAELIGDTPKVAFDHYGNVQRQIVGAVEELVQLVAFGSLAMQVPIGFRIEALRRHQMAVPPRAGSPFGLTAQHPSALW